jgi:hypothetical protein
MFVTKSKKSKTVLKWLSFKIKVMVEKVTKQSQDTSRGVQ